MKTRFLAFVVLLTLVSCTAFADGTQMDLTLEGPWILYRSSISAPGPQGHPPVSTPVLIAVAPMAKDSYNSPLYHSPMVSEGDGYFIPSNGVFCLLFDGTCAKGTGGAFSQDPNFPKANLLPVQLPSSANGSWDVFSLKDNAYILILPVPDSYSNDGMW